MGKKLSQGHKAGQIRIIGGRFRSRLIPFPLITGLRPTPNRIRETLFNWLSPNIEGANCLDLFAGSGALSFEAKSRGAGYCLLLDASHEIVQSLRQIASQLHLTEIQVIQATFPYKLELIQQKFDIVFVDPPFYQGYVQLALDWLSKSELLKTQALIYIESELGVDKLNMPDSWEILRDKKAGNVRYRLIQTS